jgi:hypothetical protein
MPVSSAGDWSLNPQEYPCDAICEEYSTGRLNPSALRKRQIRNQLGFQQFVGIGGDSGV